MDRRRPQANRHPADLHGPVPGARDPAPAGRVRDPARGPREAVPPAEGTLADASRLVVGHGRAVKAGGMIYITSMGPVDPETGRAIPGGIKEHAHQCLRNLQAKLEAEGSSLEKIVWASW